MSTNQLATKLRETKEREQIRLDKANKEYETISSAKRLALACITESGDIKVNKEQAIKAVVSTCFDNKSVNLEPVLSQDNSYVTGLAFKVVENGVTVPLHKEGAGVQSTVSYTTDLLNTAFSSSQARLKVLDEPFIHIAKDRIDTFAPAYMEIAKELGIQLVIVTHEQFFVKNRVKLTKINNKVHVTYGKE